MYRFWSEHAKSLKPYVPGEQPKDKNWIKLNTNENPYPPSPRVIQAIDSALNMDLRLYPDNNGDTLREAIAGHYGVKKEEIFVGNGSDEILAFSFAAFFNPGQPVFFPDVTYAFYPVYADMFHIDYRKIPLNDAFDIDVESFLAPNGGIILPNPNAPTGKGLPVTEIKRMIEYNLQVSVRVTMIDEAYIDFGGETVVPLIHDYPNLLVIQTLSKSRSLAGLRSAFAIGHPDLIEALNRIKNTINNFTLDRLAIIGAAEAVNDEAYFEETRRKVMATRDWVTKDLRAMGFKVLDSQANFVFISHPSVDAVHIYQYLKEHNILVRHFNQPRIDNYLRVSIGSDDDMQTLIKRLRGIVENPKDH